MTSCLLVPLLHLSLKFGSFIRLCDTFYCFITRFPTAEPYIFQLLLIVCQTEPPHRKCHYTHFIVVLISSSLHFKELICLHCFGSTDIKLIRWFWIGGTPAGHFQELPNAWCCPKLGVKWMGVCTLAMTLFVPMWELSSGKWFRCTSLVQQITEPEFEKILCNKLKSLKRRQIWFG